MEISNMANINSINTNIDLSVQIFDNFYNYQQSVAAQEYDAVHSYLLSVFGTTTQANNFTTTMFRIASASGIPVMDLLQDIKGMSGPQITLNFAFYLNTFQSPSTMLGIQATITPNYYIAHNIKQ
jgi:hypothetical protein